METGIPDRKEIDKERRQVKIVCPVAVSKPLFDCKRLSKWKRVIRITSYIKRFIQNCRIKCGRNERNQQPEVGPLSNQELENAEEYWLKQMQSNLLKRLPRGDFKTMSPYKDDRNILRVGGRVDPTLFSNDERRPALLPYDHHLSTLIVRDAHETSHSGVATTVAKIRRKYWVIKAHRIAKVVKQRCTTCRKLEAKVETQLMATLPPCRLQPCTPPFLFSTMDYFGPINVKVGRNKTVKHYGVVFTCMNTIAIHCEIAVAASTMELLQVLRRLFSYRGYPKVLLSDNGTQMVGANNELKLMIEGWNKDQLEEFCSARGMKWQFITPLAPHQNGCSEAMVKSVKQAMKKAIGYALLTPFELYTCVLEAANLVNQRPIARVPTDPDDGGYLCPNDILLGRGRVYKTLNHFLNHYFVVK
jgi:transposase InsO family protein